MAQHFEYSLTNSKGMTKVVSFVGLEFPIVIAPTLHGEPLLTTQAIYYLSSMESVVRIRFEKYELIPKHNSHQELERVFEYVIDNYLFEYSKKYPDAQITSKITELKYWKNEGYLYRGYDENKTLTLILDRLNDESIVDITNDDFPNKEYWNDWCLVSNYIYDYIDTYVKSMKSVLSKTVIVETKNHEELDSGRFLLPLLQVEDGILNYYQAKMLQVLSPDNLNVKNGFVSVSRGYESEDNFVLPLEEIRAERYYDADLLSYYFAAIREHLPISKFRCFYNVLEYFFEEAPNRLDEKAENERKQISCVVRWVTSSIGLRKFIDSQDEFYIQNLETDLISSTGIKISGVILSAPNLEYKISEWLYDIRCAVIHSKKTRKGNVQARLVPYSEDEILAGLAIPIIQYLAVLCIEKDVEV